MAMEMRERMNYLRRIWEDEGISKPLVLRQFRQLFQEMELEEMIENSERSQTTSGTHPAFAFGVSVINFGLSAESRQLGLPTGCESDLWHSRSCLLYTSDAADE